MKERTAFSVLKGKELTYWGVHRHSRQHVYRARLKDCQGCPRKQECTRDRSRSLSYHIYEASIEKARRLTKTAAYRISQRMRKKIEELFGEAKEFMGLRRAKFRLRQFVREQVLMTATAQNIKRMVKLLSRREPRTRRRCWGSRVCQRPALLCSFLPLSAKIRESRMGWFVCNLFRRSSFFNRLSMADPYVLSPIHLPRRPTTKEIFRQCPQFKKQLWFLGESSGQMDILQVQ